jgi:uncharacterized protein (TIGR00369 family)
MATPVARQMNEYLGGFDRHYGLELLDFKEGEARAQVRVREEICQPYGLVHGGIFASLAESLASLATGLALAHEGMLAFGMSNATSFLRPVTDGSVHALARRLHAGRTSWIWDVECRDDAGRLCAVTRMTIAVRKPDPERADLPLTPRFPQLS